MDFSNQRPHPIHKFCQVANYRIFGRMCFWLAHIGASSNSETFRITLVDSVYARSYYISFTSTTRGVNRKTHDEIELLSVTINRSSISVACCNDFDITKLKVEGEHVFSVKPYLRACRRINYMSNFQ